LLNRQDKKENLETTLNFLKSLPIIVTTAAQLDSKL